MRPVAPLRKRKSGVRQFFLNVDFIRRDYAAGLTAGTMPPLPLA